MLEALERCYDALPRPYCRVEEHGPFTLFIPETAPWPYYARPSLDAKAFSVADLEGVLARQRELGLPEAVEWVDDVTPELLPAARELGLDILLAPLMVLDRDVLPELDGRARLLDPESATFIDDCVLSRAVQAVGFRNLGTQTGDDGLEARDAAIAPADPLRFEFDRMRLRDGSAAFAIAGDPVQCAGAYQRAFDVVELVGIATLPAARRQGLGASVVTALARQAVQSGADTVFLSAASDDVARMYARAGFRRVGTACVVG